MFVLSFKLLVFMFILLFKELYVIKKITLQNIYLYDTYITRCFKPIHLCVIERLRGFMLQSILSDK